ncbi:MAG: hypothetical protein GX434_07090 [Peptococcaceae bacterium]|nr:hypothetical protein [Peptococcaceae bacterium]
MAVNQEDKQMKELMGQIFPGCEDFKIDSVTPSISGQDPIVSFLVVCNDEASKDFMENQEVSVEVIPSVDEKQDLGMDLNLRIEFSFPVFSLQFFTTVQGENPRQGDFARVLSIVDFFVVWLVDKNKDVLKVLKVQWDAKKYQEILSALTKK